MLQEPFVWPDNSFVLVEDHEDIMEQCMLQELFVWPDNSFVLVEDYEDIMEQWRGDDFYRIAIPSNVPFEDISQYLREQNTRCDDAASKVFWMVDYCKQKGLTPADDKAWEEAELAYQNHCKK